MLRRLLLGAAALVLLYALLVVVVRVRVDPAALKPQIELLLADRYQHLLRMDGEPRLSVFPGFAIELPRSTVSERGAGRPFARFERARVGAALLPLLAGRLQPEHVEISGLDADIATHSGDGASIDDLIAAVASRNAPGGIAFELIDGTLALRRHGRPLLTLSKLNLAIGAPGRSGRASLALAAWLAIPDARTDGAVAMSATWAVDPQGEAATMEDVRLAGKISRGSVAFELEAAARRIDVGPTMAIKGLNIAVQDPGAAGPVLKIGVGELSATQAGILADGLLIEGGFVRGSSPVAVRAAGVGQASIGAGEITVRQVQGQVTVGERRQGNERPPFVFDGAMAIGVAPDAVSLSFEGTIDETQVTAAVSATGLTRPKIAFDVKAGRIDLDRYLPTGVETVASGLSAFVRDSDLSVLRGLEAGGRLRLSDLRLGGLRAGDITVSASAGGGVLRLEPISASIDEGRIDAAVLADIVDDRIVARARLASVRIAPLVGPVAGGAWLEGTGDVDLQIESDRASTGAAARALAGRLRLQLRDGSIAGIDLLSELRHRAPAAGSEQREQLRRDPARQTQFAELSAEASFADGVARIEAIHALAPNLRLSGSGRIDLVGSRIDVALLAAVAHDAAGDGVRPIAARDFSVPVSVSGTLNEASFVLDWPAMTWHGSPPSRGRRSLAPPAVRDGRGAVGEDGGRRTENKGPDR